MGAEEALWEHAAILGASVRLADASDVVGAAAGPVGEASLTYQQCAHRGLSRAVKNFGREVAEEIERCAERLTDLATDVALADAGTVETDDAAAQLMFPDVTTTGAFGRPGIGLDLGGTDGFGLTSEGLLGDGSMGRGRF